MDVEEAIRTQRVVRRFSGREIGEQQLRGILNAGRRAGSSKNQQRWSFIVVRDRKRLAELADVGTYAKHVAGAAAAIALVTPDPDAEGAAHSITWDVGRVAQNMILLAWSWGIGSVPATVYEQELCRSILGYPSDQHCEYILSFGQPADPDELSRPPKAGGRLPLDELVHQEHWGG
jgi:nitroreductase